MNGQKNSRSQNSKRAHAKREARSPTTSDQNSVTGRVDSGGIVIQSGKHHIEITQYFGEQRVSVEKQNVLRSTKITTQYFEPETIYITEGVFWMGSPVGEEIPDYETPRHEIYLPAFRIGKYPISNAQYEEFINQTKTLVTPSMGWDGQRVPNGLENYPVTGVNWYGALAYCKWLCETTGRKYSLPNEAQWEKACRGDTNSIYPWGNKFDSARCNYGNSTVAPVDAYPAQNEYGCFDLVGNAHQWTCTLWGEKRTTPDPKYTYPWKDDARNDLNANHQIRRVMRGSSMTDELSLLRCSARSGQLPDDAGLPGARHGFRVVMNP